MQHAPLVVSVLLALALAAPAAAGPSRKSDDLRFTLTPGREPAPATPSRGSNERLEVQVLLSSIDMTVSLIDAYGSCREEERSHEECMAMIRNTLEHARRMIGKE